MLGIIIEIILSFLLLKYIARQNLDAIGLRPSKSHLFQLVTGICWAAGFFCLFKFLVAWLVGNPYRVNPNYNFADFRTSVLYLLRAVGYEELIFRGALLYILIVKVGKEKAILVSAVAFGIYHWFAWQAFGNPMQMLIIFLTTGSAGYIFALAFVRTGSMYLAAGLHFGSNLANMVFFSKDKAIGLQWLLKSFPMDPVVPMPVISILMLFMHFAGFQLLTYWWLQQSTLFRNRSLQLPLRKPV
jgi:membrane protease YdiL (CAAX protease family)